MSNLNPYISADCVIFGFDNLSLKVLLFDRSATGTNTLTNNVLKLPGNMVFNDEDVDNAAYRILKDLTGFDNIFLKQFKVFGAPNRLNNTTDLNWLQAETGLTINRVVTIAYYALIKIPENHNNHHNIVWTNVLELPQLAFDHNDIVQQGLLTLRRELEYQPIAYELLPKKFTIRQLQTLYEIIMGQPYDSRNFRKKIMKLDYIIPINEKESNVSHKPAQYFKFDKKKYMVG